MNFPFPRLLTAAIGAAFLGLSAGCAQFDAPLLAGDPAVRQVDGTGHRNPEQIIPDVYPDGAQPSPEPVVRHGRYTLVSTAPSAEQRDLLAQIIDVRIPTGMTPNVKETMDYVLRTTGYSLCSAPMPEVATLYGLPLPAAHYQLGPMTLRNTLQILAGPAFKVEVDEIARNVCFAVRPEYRPAPVASMGEAK